MPEDTGFYIDDVCIPHTWYPVEAGRNAQIVVTYDYSTHFISIDSGIYNVKDLGVAIVLATNKQIPTSKNVASATQYLESNYIAKTSNL